MKLLVILVPLVALCTGSAIPTIPGDNSHYVEGGSRYIWMPDGNGVPVLVDLEAPVEEELLHTRNGANNQYWLFTRSNPNSAQVLVHGDKDSVSSSNYNGDLPTKVIVHGWNSNGNSDMNPLITAAFLDTSDCNVIVVDWRSLANSLYTTAVRGVPDVGIYLGDFLIWLFDNAGGDWNNVHLVGFSLGAHVVGNAGRQAEGRPSRVTGLDPAGPQWGGNALALNINSGIYVESIHTDGGLLGIFDPISHADFYPNGGRNPQPGCWISTCSHGRAPTLFASTVLNNYFVANRCVDLNEARNNRCTGDNFNMGNADLNKRGSGLFAMTTGSSWPFI